MAAFGISPDDAEAVRDAVSVDRPDYFVVDPRNQQALELFLAARSQWRISMSGVTGLCYEALIPMIQLYATKKQRQRELFEQVQLIEQGALNVILKSRK